MPQRRAHSATGSPGPQDDAEPLASESLRVVDHAGRRRRGSVLVLPRRALASVNTDLATGEDFRIIVLAEPPEGSVLPAEGVAVVVPARPLSWASRLRESAAPYRAGAQSALSLPLEDVEKLREGSITSRSTLRVGPEDVFSGGRARLTLLARDLLLSAAAGGYLQALSTALAAPGAAPPATLDRIADLRALISAARERSGGEPPPELDDAASRLDELAVSADEESLLICAERLYPARPALNEDLYLLRAFEGNPEEAADLLAVRRFLAQAAVPAEETDLGLDRSLLLEQLTLAALVTDPNRLALATAALARFRQRFAGLYRERHTAYWAEMARLRARLMAEESLAEALRRINTLAELGPPAGVGALAAWEALLEETSPCPLIKGIEEVAATEGTCPECGTPLDHEPPARRVEEILDRIRRACEKQMTRLSSSAIRLVLRRSDDPRVERFLKVVQASQLTSFQAILDDDLIGYVRRFLVETKIHDALEPLLSRVQAGASPNVDEAQTAMREVSRVLQHAFQSGQRALPPGTASPKAGPGRRKRKE